MKTSLYLSAQEAREAAKEYNDDEFYQCLIQIKEAADKGQFITVINKGELKQETVDSLTSRGFEFSKRSITGHGMTVEYYYVSWN